MSADLPDRYPDLFAKSECPSCGYLLTGLPRCGKCPECGQPYDDRSTIVLYGRIAFGLGGRSWLYRVAILAFGLIVVAGSVVAAKRRSLEFAGALMVVPALAMFAINRASGRRAVRITLSPNGYSSIASVHNLFVENPGWGWGLASAGVALPFLLDWPDQWKIFFLVVVGVSWSILRSVRMVLRQADVPPVPLARLLRPSGWRQLAADYRLHRSMLTHGPPFRWSSVTEPRFERVDDQQVRVAWRMDRPGRGWWLVGHLPLELIIQVPAGQLPALQTCVREWWTAAATERKPVAVA